jgi:Flp pilus assembly protein TadD
MRSGRYREAVEPLRRASALEPGYLAHRHTLAVALSKCGRGSEASDAYRAVLKLSPGFVPSLAGLAWLLATHHDAALRNGEEAVRLASRAAELEPGNPNVMNTLAAAYAEAGRFDEAVTVAEAAVKLAERMGMSDFARAVRSRLELYRQGRPFRE